MSDSKPPALPPKVPSNLWTPMPPESKERLTALYTAMGLDEHQAALLMRYRVEVYANIAFLPGSVEHITYLNAIRDDALASRKIASEEADKIMWQAMYALNEAQRTADLLAKAREDERRDMQRRQDRALAIVGATVGMIGLVVSILVAVFK